MFCGMKKLETIRFLKFCIVGGINTLVTYITYVFLRYLGIIPEICNASGYVLGVINSFLWNKIWVFKTKKTNVQKEALSFFIVFVICYCLQFILFNFLIYNTNCNEYLAQFIGMILYTILNYVLNRLFSFKKKYDYNER